MNEQEFNHRVMVFSGKFYGYSFKILGDKEEARDIVQELYLKLWAIRNTLNSINSIEAYATTIIRNLCVDRLKKIKGISLQAETYLSFSKNDGIDPGESHEETVQERVEMVRKAMKQLPDIQQKVFIMRDFEEKEFEEISEELALSAENVRVILSRARKRIREIIESNKMG